MRFLRVILIPVVFFAISMFFEFLSSTSLFDTILRELFKEDMIQTAKEIIEVINHGIFVIPLFWQATSRGFSASKCNDLTKKLGINNRAKLTAILSQSGFVEATQEDINIRIFRKRFGRLVLRDLDGFCARNIDSNLSFSIRKKEGLCVQAFLEKKSKLELESASKAEYHLNGRQQALAGNLQFIVAVPICNENGSSVKYVICFDSFKQIARTGSETGIIKICEAVAYDISSVID